MPKPRRRILGWRSVSALSAPLRPHLANYSAVQQVKIAIYASFIANCVLACLQLYAALSSLSLSFFATAIDSVFDPASNVILNVCHKKAANVDLRKYPSVRLSIFSFAEVESSLLLPTGRLAIRDHR